MANIPAIDGFATAAAAVDARVLLLQSDRQVQAPVLNIGLQPLDSDLTTIAGLSPADGAVLIGNGSSWTADTTPTLTGLLTVNGQIAFPASQNASANANTLDDYEEGTWTPTVVSTVGTLTTVSATGSYNKIGRAVFYTVVIILTTNGTGASSIAFSYPFTATTTDIPIWGKEIALTGKAVIGAGFDAGSAYFTYYDATYPGANATRFVINGRFNT